jgi:hypothetical protein
MSYCNPHTQNEELFLALFLSFWNFSPLDIPQVRTSRYGKKTFKFAAATLWNSLPDHFRTENSFSQFKNLM